MPTAAKKRRQAIRDDAIRNDTGAMRSLMATRQLNLSVVQDVLKLLRETPALANATRGQLTSAQDGPVDTTIRTEKVSMVDGSTWDWEFCDPNLLLARTLADSPFLAQMYATALEKAPCSRERPWSLVVVFDEFTPGSIAHQQLDRKTMNLAFNFLELGLEPLSAGSTWLMPVLARTKKLSQAVGGWSACLAIYLRAHLLGDLGIERVGVSFRAGDKSYTLFARLQVLCSDGEGLQYGLDMKGPAGLRPCIRCQNVLKKGSGLAHRRPEFVEITCADHTKFIKSEPEDLDADVAAVLDAWAQVNAHRISAARAQRIETAHGLNANPTGLLACGALRRCFSVLDVINEDWMHGALQDGVLFVGINLTMVAVKDRLDLDLESLEKFLRGDWLFPKARRSKMGQIWRMFDAHARARMDERQKFKYNASELLGLYVLLRHFMLAVVVPVATARGADLDAEISVFLAWCTVIDIIMALKQGFAQQDDDSSEVLLQRLEAALDKAMALQMRVHGDASFKPKHHRMQHIADQIRRFKFVIDAFIIERLHLVVKDVLAKVHNPIIFERSLLRGAYNKQLLALQSRSDFNGLAGPTAPLQGYPGSLAAKNMNFCGMAISVGDVVFRGEVAGEVTVCASEGHRIFAIVQVWREVGVVTAYMGKVYSRRWQRMDVQEAWPAEELELAVASYTEGDDIVILKCM